MKILSHLAHSTYQTNLSKIPDTVYYHIVNGETLKKSWDDQTPKPENIFEISEREAKDRLNEFDILLLHSHGYMEYFKDWKIKKIFLEHTGPYPDGGFQQRHWAAIREKWVDYTVFITHSSLEDWGMVQDDQNSVIYHAMDVDSYPNYSNTPENFIMTTVNAFIERDWACGFGLWNNVIWPFEDVRVYGWGNENLGTKYAKGSVPHSEILQLLTKAGVYFNPSTVSPIPMSMLEAMAVGTPIVTTAFYEPGRIMQNNIHGIITNDSVELREGIKFMLENREKAREMGENAKNLVKEKFTLDAFVENWQKVFEKVKSK